MHSAFFVCCQKKVTEIDGKRLFVVVRVSCST